MIKSLQQGCGANPGIAMVSGLCGYCASLHQNAERLPVYVYFPASMGAARTVVEPVVTRIWVGCLISHSFKTQVKIPVCIRF